MSATIDYEIKKALKFLSKDCRWNVLTVLILHANVRNRCWPSMDTIQEMATSGNRAKATRAKKWLEKHGAFELVKFDKRVAEELKFQPRQHVYQLTGLIKTCADKKCDCGATGETFHYLYLGKSSSIETFENVPIETFESSSIETLSISNEVLPVEVVAPLDRKAQAELMVRTWLKAAGRYSPLAYDHAKAVELALPLVDEYTLEDVRLCTATQCKNRPMTNLYHFSYLVKDLVGFKARRIAQAPTPAKGLDAFSQHRLEMMQEEKARKEQAAS